MVDKFKVPRQNFWMPELVPVYNFQVPRQNVWVAELRVEVHYSWLELVAPVLFLRWKAKTVEWEVC